MSEEDKRIYIIPHNYTSFVTMSEMIKPRNLLEAIFVTVGVGKLLSYVPFVSTIKMGITGVVCLICFIIFFVGYKEESILSFWEGLIRYKLTCGVKRFHIPDEETAKMMNKKTEGEMEESYADKLIKKIKYRAD